VFPFFKRALNLFLSVFFFHFNQLKNSKDKTLYYSSFIRKTSFSKKNLMLLKYFLYLIKQKKMNKNFFLLQKRFFIHFLKKKKFLKKSFTFAYIKNFFSYLLKIEPNNLTKQNITLFKDNLYKTYFKSTKSNAFLLYKKLIGIITKNGKKAIATKLLNNTFINLKNDLKFSTNFILLKILNRLKVSIETKKIKIKRSSHLLPLPIKQKRKVFLISKWLILGAKNQKSKKGFDSKLKLELHDLICSKESFSYKYKKYNIFKSLQNRANTHFRW
jgi:small subunit ribosomal protein S7